MSTTSLPGYALIMPKPVWTNGSDHNTYGQRRVRAGMDEIKATDINNIRDAIDLMWSHDHDYHDSVGSC